VDIGFLAPDPSGGHSISVRQPVSGPTCGLLADAISGDVACGDLSLRRFNTNNNTSKVATRVPPNAAPTEAPTTVLLSWGQFTGVKVSTGAVPKIVVVIVAVDTSVVDRVGSIDTMER
jgi:hypothetical protein